MVKKTKKPNDRQVGEKLWSKPIVIDGQTISEKELAEFLDWSFVNDNKDFAYFQYLKKSGKLKAVTSTQLLNKVKSLSSK